MKKISTQLYLLLLLSITSLSACLKGSDTAPAFPVVATYDVILDSTSVNAWSGGIITTGTSFSAYGICYSTTNQEPTINDTKNAVVVSLLSFNANISGLSPNTTYYARAYATNTAGTGYGNVVQFTTGNGVITTYGQVSTFAGATAAGLTNGTGTAASFNHPSALTTDLAGNIYVADAFNNVIRKITADGTVTTVAGTGVVGYLDGPAKTAQFYAPSGLAVDASGNIYVADKGNNMIRKISTDGTVSTLAGKGDAGYDNGTGIAASFNTPTALVLDLQGNIIVADYGNNEIRKVTTDGVVTTVAGNLTAGYINGLGTAAYFYRPSGITKDAAGNLYVTEPYSNAIRKINTDYLVTTFAGGLETGAQTIGKPQAITIDGNGNFYICDANGRVLKISKDRVLTEIAGKSGSLGYKDGVGATALFSNPLGVTTDAKGAVYIADEGNNRIRKIN